MLASQTGNSTSVVGDVVVPKTVTFVSLGMFHNHISLQKIGSFSNFSGPCFVKCRLFKIGRRGLENGVCLARKSKTIKRLVLWNC